MGPASRHYESPQGTCEGPKYIKVCYHFEVALKSEVYLYWFSVKWRIGSPELFTTGRPSPRFGLYSYVEDSGLSPRGIYRLDAIPKGKGKSGTQSAGQLPTLRC